MVQDWFKYLLVPDGLVTVAPIIQKTKQTKKDADANPPFGPGITKIQRSSGMVARRISHGTKTRVEKSHISSSSSALMLVGDQIVKVWKLLGTE